MKYGIKIDLRRSKCFDDTIRKCVRENKLWVDESEGDYTFIQDAKVYDTEADAELSITEDWEMVCKLTVKQAK